VDLMVEIANQDEKHFPSGHALDLHAGPFHHGSHFALGAGQHACAAASLIRMAVTVATKVFIQSFGPAAQADPVEWRGGSGFRWAARVYAQRRA
jgi:cytochrome P450